MRMIAPMIDTNRFLAEVRRLGGTTQGATDWLEAAKGHGLSPDDTAESLAWLCVDDELSNLDPADDRERCAALKASLEAARTK